MGAPATWDEDSLSWAHGAAISDLAAITGGESPTEAEHNAVRTAVNSILAALRSANILAAD